MKFWALADLHLNIGVPEKDMQIFGPSWTDYTKKISLHWKSLIKEEDVVLIPGDISWAMKTKDAQKDLDWIDQLPGKKVLLKGNHDHWWTSKSKVEKMLSDSMFLVQNNCVVLNDVAIAGARLWDTDEYGFDDYIIYRKNPKAKNKVIDLAHEKALFQKELVRLETSLQAIPPQIKTRIAMTHYPPVGPDLNESKASKLLEKYGIQYCVFGHLHNVKKNALQFGVKNGIEYLFTAADYRDFSPVLILSK